MSNQSPEASCSPSREASGKVRLQYASGNALTSLGIRPALGRLLNPSDDLRPGAHPVAVLSYDFWMRRFGGDPAVLGRWSATARSSFRSSA